MSNIYIHRSSTQWYSNMALPSGDTLELPRYNPVPHALHHGCRLRHLSLGDSGVSKRGRHGGTWPADMELFGILLHRWRTCCLDPTREDAAGVWRPCRPLRPGWTQDEYVEDGEHGLLAMSHTCHNVDSGVLEAEDGDKTDVSGSTEDAGTMSGVWSWGHGGVTADAPSESEQCGMGGSVGSTPPPPPSRGGPYLPDILLKNAFSNPVPGRGVPGRDAKQVQPPGSPFTPLYTGQNCDPGGG